MPEDQKFKNINKLLTPKQMSSIVSELTKYGVEEVRLTGGEPLLHPNFKEIVKALSLCDLKKLALTTNAIRLDKYLDFLREQNIKHLNISFDSLNPNVFEYITKTTTFSKVLENILLAKKMGFKIKLNIVLMKNLNFEEIEDFLHFSAKNNIEVRFLEMMKIGYARKSFDRHFVSADEAINKIERSWKLEKVNMPVDSTSFNYIASHNGLKAQVGFIASESKPFCSGCSRLRLSNQGELRPCIMIGKGPNISKLETNDYEVVLNELINKKPLTRLEQTEFQMNEIGG